MADNEQVFLVCVVAQEFLEVFEGGAGSEGGGRKDLGFVACLGAYEGGGLEAALERARDDEAELYVQSIQHMREVDALLLALFVEGALRVQHWVSARHPCTGVAEDK